MENKYIIHILWRKEKVHNYYMYLNLSWKLKIAILHLTWSLIFIPLSTFLSHHLTKSWFFLPPLEFFHLNFVIAWDFAIEEKMICMFCVPYYANLSLLSPSCHSPFQLKDNFLQFFFYILVYPIITFFFYRNQSSFYLPYFSFLLSQIFWQITLFLFQNLNNPVFIE